MRFAEPVFIKLFWGLLASGALLFVYRYLLPRHSSASPGRISFVLRVLGLCAVCLALAAPYAQHQIAGASAALLLLDVSSSLEGEAGQALIKQAAAYQGGGISLEVIPFAKKAASVSESLRGEPDYAATRKSWEKLQPDGTSLQKAVEAISRYEEANILLASDGNETEGSFEAAISLLRPGKTRIYPLVPENLPKPAGRFQISSLLLPLQTATQNSVDVKVSLENTTEVEQSALLEVYHDEKQVLSRKVKLAAGNRELFTAQSDPAAEGIKEVRAVLKPDDSAMSGDSRIAYLASRQRERVLLISGSTEDQRLLEPVLQSQAWQLKSINAGEKFDSLPDLSSYSVLVLNNSALTQLPARSDSAIAGFVRDGGGLVMVGGNRSFGLGGYKDSKIEEVLPVNLVPPQTVSKRLNLAVELVLDKSRSMEFGAKIEYVKEAAKEVIRNLKDDDYVGLIGFDSVPFEVIRLVQIGPMRAQALERVGRLYPSGKTNLLPAMEQARLRLTDVEAGRKHMIVLTDGQIPDSGPYYLELVKKMRLNGITLSTVMVGSESDFGFLHSMGDAGGGSFYQTDDPRSIPRIFMSDIKVTTGERSLKEESEYVVRNGPAGIKSTSVQGYPPLRGYVQTAPKKDANLELVVLADERAEPLLASWNYKEGRAIAYTSDASGRWSSYWAPWPRFQTFWGDIVSAARSDAAKDEGSIEFDLRYSLEYGALALDLSLFDERASSSLESTLLRPDKSSEKLSFQRLSRGHFRALVTKPTAGKYEFKGKAGGQKLGPVAFNLPDTEFGERKGQGFNLSVLERLANASGGKINPALEDLKAGGSLRLEKRDLSYFFYLAALLLICLEIVWRELLAFRWRW